MTLGTQIQGEQHPFTTSSLRGHGCWDGSKWQKEALEGGEICLDPGRKEGHGCVGEEGMCKTT